MIKVSSFSLLILLSLIIIFFGDVSIFDNANKEIINTVIFELRIPKVLTAIAAGGILAICGLWLQTYFNNPLAGPFVLGIHGGASLAVAIWIYTLQAFSIPLIFHQFGVIGFSMMGSFLMLLLIIMISKKLVHKSSLMIVGLLMGFFTSGILSIFASVFPSENLQTFYLWTLGSFQRLSLQHSFYFLALSLGLVIYSFRFNNHLNLLLLGESYAKSLGLDIVKFQRKILILCSIIVGLVISLCGPIAFIGLMGPHLSRLILKTADHRSLTFFTFIIGSSLALFAEVFASSFSSFSFPLNATLSLVGIPLFLVLFVFGKNRTNSERI